MKNFASALFVGAAIAAALAAGSTSAQAGSIPYPNSGTYNPTTYSFTAAQTGDVVAYFAGSGAAYDNRLGMLDNGVLTSAGFGLDDHTSSIGQSFDLGTVHAGDVLVFVLENLTLGKNAYSDPSLNASYDLAGDTVGHNHIYSTLYNGTSPALPGVPAGTYVAFEDLPFPNSDFNYFDETYVFTNVATNVPEPATLVLFGIGLLGIGAMRRKAA